MNTKQLIGLATIALTAGTVSVVASADAAPAPRRLHFIEHEVTSGMIDNGAPGFSAGDIFTIHSDMLDDARRPVGRADIYGVVTEALPDEQSFAGTGTIHLPGGMISFASGGFEPEHVVDAITGGTGLYRGARGEIVVKETEDSPDALITIVLTN